MANGKIPVSTYFKDILFTRLNEFSIYNITCTSTNTLTIFNAAKIKSRPRATLFCVYSDQYGLTYVFRIFTGPGGNELTLSFLHGSPTAEITASNNDLTITGFGNWGYGFAIGFN